MPTVKSHAGKKGGGKKGELHRVTIDKAKNGVSVQSHRHPAPGSNLDFMSHGSEAPNVFQKHGPAKKHIAGLMSEMMPQGADNPQEEADETESNQAGGEMGAGAPVAQVG